MPPAPAAAEPEWPPRSPRDALLLTPGGRERLRRMMNRTSPTPSPLRKAKSVAETSSRSAGMKSQEADNAGDDEEEDEETLQLKLQEIQARLKLKKLQSAKAKQVAAAEELRDRPLSAPPPKETRPHSGLDRLSRPTSQATVEVPVSPIRKAQPAPSQTSPSRILLGIDKGLRAKDISLKRAPSLRRPQSTQEGGGQHQTGGYLRTARTQTPDVTTQQQEPKPLSFNERLSSARTAEVSRHERQERIKSIRTNAFSISKEEMETYKQTAVELPDEEIAPPQFSRDEIMSGLGGGGLRRSNTVPSVRTQPSADARPPDAEEPYASLDALTTFTTASAPTTATTATPARVRKPKVAAADVPESEAASFEPYSGLHLKQRILPHPVLTRHMSGKKVMNLKDLLKVVKSPDYALPDVEQDIVILAIVAKKSEPRTHKPTSNTVNPERGKYMVLTIVDLQFEVELFLFNSGFQRFWKITEGTVVAILNPSVMPPPANRVHNGRFSLVIKSDADTIIEIGAARDLGFCKSIKKNGNPCGDWVNCKRTHFCEYHTNEAVDRARAARIELSTNNFGPGKKHRFRSERLPNDGKKPAKATNTAYDRETHSHWFASTSLSTADLLDGVDNRNGAYADRKEREEMLRRKNAAREKEHELVRKLGRTGNGAGRDYMRHANEALANHNNSSSTLGSSIMSSGTVVADDMPGPPADAKSLGLLPKGGAAIRLSPIKRKRPDSSQSGSDASSHHLPLKSSLSSASGTAMGWGSNLKDKLARMKEGEKLRPEADRPMRKKTRFVTDKGIREAGRESLGAELGAAPREGLKEVYLEDDDEDELVIV